MSAVDRISSFDIYTKHKPGSVIATQLLMDVNSGMNPCYYIRSGDKLKVSTSVASLILDAGNLELNPAFRPPKFIMHSWQRNAVDQARKLAYFIDNKLRTTGILHEDTVKRIKSIAPQDAKVFLWDPHYSAHISCESIDKRITKLRPFESVSVHGSKVSLTPDNSMTDLDEYLQKSAHLMRRAINDIEAANPGKKHIVLMGGKDSQLISLVPKLNEQNWYIFSAEPNYDLVTQWVAENKLYVAGVYRHDGKNEESLAEFKRKVVCSDLYTNPIHVRYLPTLEKIAQNFDGECIFWVGSMPRRASLYDASHRRQESGIATEQFFDVHLNTFPAWQGNIQQTYSNYLGCPFLSPYYLEELWFNLFSHIDPIALGYGQDHRPRLADMLSGRKIIWPDRNPGPSPYEYWYFWFSPYRYYLNYVNRELEKQQ